MQKIAPYLWFNGQAEQAATHYVSLLPDSRITRVDRYGEGAPFPAGTAMVVNFQLAGQAFMALNGGPEFEFSEAVSFLISCESQEEVDRLWDALTADGGAPGPCGWLKDKFGLSWQIIPTALGELMGDPDPEKAGRVMQAMLQMQKIDIAALRRAYTGE